MADRPINLGRNTLGRDKGKAPATDLDQHDDDSSSIDRSRAQSALFLSDAPQATDEHRPRQRVSEHRLPSERMAEGRAAKRARIAALTAQQFAGPSRPFVEDEEDQDEEQTDLPGHTGHHTANRQPCDQTQVTSKAAGKKPEAGPGLIVTDPPQGSSGVQSAAHATQSAGPTNDRVYLTIDDDDEDNAIELPRIGEKGTYNELGKSVKSKCIKYCEAVALMLSGRADEEGQEIHERCLGVAAKFKRTKTWAELQNVVRVAMKRLLTDADEFLTKARDVHDAFLVKKMVDRRLMALFKRDILGVQERWVEAVEEASIFRNNLTRDLSAQSQGFLAGKFT